MATVNKNFRIKNGLIVEGATATVNGFGVLTKAQADQDYIVGLIGGTATSANTVNTVVKRDASGNFAAGTITATFIGNLTGNVTGTVSSLSNHDTADLAENAANKYFTDARALSATAAAYDAAGSAAAAQSAATTAAATDATTKVAAEAALRVSGDAASVSTAAADATSKANAAQAAAISAAATDATTKANAAQAAAEATAASALSSAISTEVSNRNTAISTAVDSLVDGAPALLNTLNELAAAINDDANYTTTITTALGTKANSADVTASLATAASNAAADATSKANAAKTAAEATAAADATTKANAAQAAAEATAAAANTAQQNGTTAFTALNVNDQAKQIAASSTSLGSVVVTAYEWPKADYRSGKFVVKIDNGTHNEISEILLTLDSSDNVAITEYAIVGTNGSRGTITADVSGSNVRVRVNPVNDSTVKITGTLLK